MDAHKVILDSRKLGDLSSLTYDILIAISRFLTPISLFYLSLTNHELNKVGTDNTLWVNLFKQSFPGASHESTLSLRFSLDGLSVINSPSYFRLFANTSFHSNRDLNELEQLTFTLMRARDFQTIIDKKIKFTPALLGAIDSKTKRKLIDLVIQLNDTDLNAYIFECLCECLSDKKEELLKWGVILDQSTGRFDEILLSENAENAIVGGETLLFWASEYSSYHSALLLLSYGAEVDKLGNNKSCTPLYNSALLGDDSMVELFVVFEADKEAIYKKSLTPVIAAAQYGFEDIVEYLHTNGANIHANSETGETALYYAMQEGQTEVAKYLLEQGADTQLKFENFTPLMIGVYFNQYNAVKMMLGYYKKYRMNVDDADFHGYTSVYICAKKNYPEACLLLLENGASITGSTKDEYTALHAASLRGHHQVVEVLCQFEQDFNHVCPDGTTALYIAAKNGREKVVKVLCSQGPGKINVNFTCKNGSTPLRVAIRKGHTEIVKTLLSAGAEINSQASNLSTPLHLAANCKRVEIMLLLIKEGANVNSQMKNGMTPLHLVCMSSLSYDECVTVIQALINAGAQLVFNDDMLISQKTLNKDLKNIIQNLEIFSQHAAKRCITHYVKPAIIKIIEAAPFNTILLQEDSSESINTFKNLMNKVTSNFGKAVLLLIALDAGPQTRLSKTIMKTLGFDYPFQAKGVLQSSILAYLGHNSVLFDDLMKYVIDPMVDNFCMGIPITNNAYDSPLLCLNFLEYCVNQALKKLPEMRIDFTLERNNRLTL